MFQFCRFGRNVYLWPRLKAPRMPINNPKEVLALVERAASDKISLPVRKILILAFLAGAYISMGGLFSIVIGYGFPSMAPAPGLQRLLSGLVFPLGLMLVVFAGAELFTGNNAVLVPGALGRRYGWRKVLENWMLVYIGNFVGSLFFACFLVKLPGCSLPKRGVRRPSVLPRQRSRCRG